MLDQYERLVYSIPLNFGLGRTDADDVAQATFSALLRSLDAIEDDERVGAWLATVARRQTWRLVERRKRESPDGGAALDLVATEHEAEAQVDRIAWLHGAMSRLDRRCRELLSVMYLDGTEPSYVDVAERVSMPVGSIGPTRARCLAKLRELLVANDP